jgi:hypothetical protein
MLFARSNHSAVYHAEHLYVLGGLHLKECERYICAESRWEPIPPLSTVCFGMTCAVVEGSLYSLGGHNGVTALDLIHRLSLQTLTWELLKLKLPCKEYYFPCFTAKSPQVYFVMRKTLYVLNPLTSQVKSVKALYEDISNSGGPSCYSRGVLYCSVRDGAACWISVGDLA